MLALALLLPAPAGARGSSDGPAVASGSPPPRVTVAMLPNETDVEQIADAVPGISPGLLGAGLGEVPTAQSYLDISQGSRLAQSLYPDVLPPVYVTGDRVPAATWRQVRDRAEDAPANIVPGLLATTLRERGIPAAAAADTGSAALIAVDEDGRIERTHGCEPGECPGSP